MLFCTVYSSAGTASITHSDVRSAMSLATLRTAETGPPHSTAYSTMQIGSLTATSCSSTATDES